MIDREISTGAALDRLSAAEPDDRATLDRRRFLQLVGMGIGSGLIGSGVSSLLDGLGGGYDPAAWAAGPLGPSDGITLVIGMYGGNDGLNTVVPFTDGAYYDQRGSLAVAPDRLLPISGDLGLNPALTSLHQFWNRGQLAIVQGVGYPNPDQSHFNSMAYWMAGRPDVAPTTGWLGRWLDGHLSAGPDLYAAAEIGTSLPLHLVGAARQGTVVPVERPYFGAGVELRDQRQYQALRSMRTDAHGPWYGAVGQAFVDQIDLAAALTPHYPEASAQSPTPIVAKLEVAARIVNANLGFRVLTAGWADFDSHANQPEMHSLRLGELNQAIVRFFEVLDPAWWSRVTIMTFSEFGRTSWGNDGRGTDHGTAAPQFVFGQNVRGGLYGERPALAGLGRWERMSHTVDFRSYYTSIIDGWMGGGGGSVLGGTFEDLGLFSRGPGVPGGTPLVSGSAPTSAPSTLIPVSPFRAMDTRDGTGGVLSRALGPGEAVRLRVVGVGPVPSSGVTAVVANVTAVECTDPNYFTVYPGSTARPFTSNLNAGPGRPVPNLVLAGVGADGTIEVYNSHGSAHCLVDVFGYFTTGPGDGFVAVSPTRLFDTRTGHGIRPGKLRGGEVVAVTAAGAPGVPVAGATAVVVNLTVAEPESPGWVRLTPTGQLAADTSNVNFFAGNVVPNLVICKLGDGGRISVDGVGSGAHVIGDVFGYFSAGGARLRAIAPRRLLDTREGIGAERGKVGPSRGGYLVVAGQQDIPIDAVGVVANVTATNVSDPTFVTVWPDGEDQPGTSNLNVVRGQTAANLVICRLGSGGAVRLASPHAECDLIADVLGYFVG